jgi:hypothetical protein
MAQLTIVDMDSQPGKLLRYLLYYVYLAPIIPMTLCRFLQMQIERLIASLEGQAKLPSFLDVPAMHRPGILRGLKSWQQDAMADYSTRYMRTHAATDFTHQMNPLSVFSTALSCINTHFC